MIWFIIAGVSFVYFVIMRGMGRVHRIHRSYVKTKTSLKYGVLHSFYRVELQCYISFRTLHLTVCELAMHYWLLLCAFLGHPHLLPADNATRIMLFSLCLTGNVVFMVYRASMTSGIIHRMAADL